jgi:hypothetical protein
MQFSPSNKIYAQALEKIRTLTRAYSTSKTRDSDQISSEVNATLKEIADQVNGPTLKYRPIEFGSNPSSFAMNEFLQSLSFDVNVILDEMNIIKAASVNTHNLIKTELLKADAENSRLHNKIKSLQLYSSSEDSSILYMGDYFYNDEYIDWSLVPPGERAELIKGDQISLGVSSQVQVLDESAKLMIESDSNGFMGNNQEVFDSQQGGIFFVREGIEETAKVQLTKIVDQLPDTFFEFEKYFISASDKSKAKNLNFQYQYTNKEEFKYLETLANEEGELFWASGEGELRLNLLIEIDKIERLNLLRFTPFGLSDNKNTPILIKSVYVSKDKNNWSLLTPQNLWVANGIDQNTLDLEGENIVINEANFRIDSEQVKYIRFEMVQPLSLSTKVGHFYYVNPSEGEEIDGSGSENLERYEGPIPPVDRIWIEKDPRASYQNNLVQRREVFNGKRWAIGIQDISALSIKYNETSTVVSKRFLVPGGVDRIAIEADIDIPEGFSSYVAWIRFFVSPDDGKTWHQISRIQDDYLGIPEVIAYNDNTPVELRLPGVGYYETNSTANHLRVKIEIDRPEGDDTLTPVVRSYRLKVKQRVTS